MEALAKILFMGVVIQVLTWVGCLAHGTEPMPGKWGLGRGESWGFSMTVALLFVGLLSGS